MKMPKIKRHEFPDFIESRIRTLKQQVVAESGNPSDEFHIGKILLTCMQNNPDSINQIDGNTGETNTNAAVVRQSKELSQAFKTWGLKQNDVIALMAPLHLKVFMPVYAGFYLGAPVQPIDGTLKLQDLKAVLNIGKAKIIFCLREKVEIIREALKEINHESTIITFDTKHPEVGFLYDEFVETYGKGYESFQLVPEREDNIALIMSTSGSTGVPKGVMISQRNFVAQLVINGAQFNVNSEAELEGAVVMNISGVSWITSFLQLVGCIVFKMPLLSTSAEITPSHVVDLINKYKPSFSLMSPSLVSGLLKHAEEAHCDFSCFKNVNLAGNVIPASVSTSFQAVLINGKASNIYGMSETGYLMTPSPFTESSAVGRANILYEYRFVDPDTGADVGPYKAGELWLKGPTIVKGYYKNLVGTKEAFSEDGWLKTGDLVTYNDEGYVFYVDRLKMLMKYKNFMISPVELEDVIHSHPSVAEVVVVGVKAAELGELPTACVVVKPQYEPNAKDIIDLVKNKLAEFKQLRGGVLFVSSIPVSSNGKMDRKQVKQLVLNNAHKIIKE